MAQAKILVNGVVGSNDDLPINSVVQLNNQSIGGESTFLWAILDQPPGSTDSLSSSSVQNPTFTPKKEGSYLIRLTVNLGLADEQSDSVIVGIRQLKTRERIPAAGESTEADTSDGWATAMNALLRSIDGLLSDPGIIVGVNISGGNLTRGDVLRATGGAVIKSGLPGQETVPGFAKAPATTLGSVDELLCVMESGVDGSSTVANNGLIRVRYIGRISGMPLGSGSVGDTVYDGDAATITLTQGTIRRQVGSIMGVDGSNRDIWFDGVGGADITPIGSHYVVYGNPGTLTNPWRIDGAAATPSTAGLPFTFLSGDTTTQALVAKAASGQTANIFEIQTNAAAVLSAFDSVGNLDFQGAAGATLKWGSLFSLDVPASDRLLFKAGGTERWKLASDGKLVPTSGRMCWDAAATWSTGGNSTSVKLIHQESGSRYMLLWGWRGTYGEGAELRMYSLDTAQKHVLLLSVPDEEDEDSVMLGSYTNSPVGLCISESMKWKLMTDGELSCVVNKKITGVADAAGGQDVVTVHCLENFPSNIQILGANYLAIGGTGPTDPVGVMLKDGSNNFLVQAHVNGKEVQIHAVSLSGFDKKVAAFSDGLANIFGSLSIYDSTPAEKLCITSSGSIEFKGGSQSILKTTDTGVLKIGTGSGVTYGFTFVSGGTDRFSLSSTGGISWYSGTFFYPPTVVNPSLSNSWVEFDSGDNKFGYYKMVDGTVRFVGSIKDGTTGLEVFTLPVGCRPTNTVYVPIRNSDGGGLNELGYAAITTAGVVVVHVAHNTSVNMSAISFLASLT